MVGRRLLLTLAVVATSLVGSTGAHAQSLTIAISPTIGDFTFDDDPEVSNNGNSVDIYVEDTYVSDPPPDPSDDGASDDSGGSSDGYSDNDSAGSDSNGDSGGDDSNGDSGGDDSGGDSAGGRQPITLSETALAPMAGLFAITQCRDCGPENAAPTRTPPRPPTSFTISDVLTLAPASVTLTAEPATWSIVGTHTNFYTTATQHNATGTILGHPLTVTFTPTTYQWDYGDGTTTTTTTPGTSWAELHQEDFTTTPTSHVYTKKTTVHASVTVAYTATVTLANGTRIPVTGTLNKTSTTLPLKLLNADTVITIGDCNQHPQQPHC